MNKSILNGTLDVLNTPLAHPVYTAELLRAIALDAVSGNRESMDTLAMIFWRYGERFPEALVESIRTILKMDDLADTEVYTHLWNCSKEQGSLVGILNLHATGKAETDVDALVLEHRPALSQNMFLRFLNEDDDYARMSPKELVKTLKRYLSDTNQGGLNRVPTALAGTFAQGDDQLRYLLLHVNLLVRTADVNPFLNGVK